MRCLSESKSLRLSTLCELYVAQGIPWGFVTVTFAAWLVKSDHHVTTEQIGPVLAVASLPWSFKFFWGPFMDRWTIRSMGRRRPWILFAQSMAILVLSSMLLLKDPAAMIWRAPENASRLAETMYHLVPGPLAALILLANIFMSMQDVAVDALAVDLLHEDERGIANGLMYGCSYLGTAIGGAGLGWVVAHFGIQAGLCGQAGMLFSIMLLPLIFKERPPTRNSETRFDDFAKTEVREDSCTIDTHTATAITTDFGECPVLMSTSVVQSSTSVFTNLRKAFSLRATVLGAVVAIGAKIGIGVLTAVFVGHLLTTSGWSQEEYTRVTGGFAVMLGLLGSAIGGFCADRVGVRRMIIVSSGLLGLLWIAFGLAPSSLESKTLVTGLLLSQEFLTAVLSVSLFCLFMTISWPVVAATQFTTYMALMNLSTTIGNYMSGECVHWLSIHQILILSGSIQLLVCLPVLLIDPGQTRRILGDT